MNKKSAFFGDEEIWSSLLLEQSRIAFATCKTMRVSTLAWRDWQKTECVLINLGFSQHIQGSLSIPTQKVIVAKITEFLTHRLHLKTPVNLNLAGVNLNYFWGEIRMRESNTDAFLLNVFFTWTRGDFQFGTLSRKLEKVISLFGILLKIRRSFFVASLAGFTPVILVQGYYIPLERHGEILTLFPSEVRCLWNRRPQQEIQCSAAQLGLIQSQGYFVVTLWWTLKCHWGLRAVCNIRQGTAASENTHHHPCVNTKVVEFHT